MYLACRLAHSRATAQITLNPVEFSGGFYCCRALRKDNYLKLFKVIYASKKCACILLEINFHSIIANMDIGKNILQVTADKRYDVNIVLPTNALLFTI